MNSKKIFLIGEIGINHNGSVENAKALILIAKKVGFDAVKFEPKPVQRPHPPIHVGGESAAALRRVARHGDGWYGIGHTLDTVKPVLKALREIVAAEGRNPEHLEIITASEAPSYDELRRWEDLGVTRLVVCPWKRGSQAVAGLQHFAEQVLDRV